MIALMLRISPRTGRLLKLAGISLILLFVELACIRWLAAEIRSFAFYKNVVLMACFLGMGAGATLGRARGGARWFVPALAGLVLLVHLAAPALNPLVPPGGDLFVWNRSTHDLRQILQFYVALITIAVLTCGVFFLGGQALGAAFEDLDPLPAYSANLIGSLAGTLAFTALSATMTPPAVWFGLALVGASTLQWRELSRPVALGAAALALLFFWLVPSAAIWSPYYKLTVTREQTPDGKPWGVSISANGFYHLKAVDLRPEFLKPYGAGAEQIRLHYDLPYLLSPSRPGRVLVVGAGAGNDVAAALRAGAESVVAVEIDPAIAEIGRRLHPERPYGSPRVQLVIDDGRAYLTRAKAKFDLIVFGLIDSHGVVSSLSNVRLDSYLYTEEALARASELLSPRGMIAVSFSSGFGESWWILQRIESSIAAVFGKTPLALAVGYDQGYMFLAGPGAPTALADPGLRRRAETARAQLAENFGPVKELTDDWPFLYIRGPYIPTEFLVLFAALLVLATLLVTRMIPGGARGIGAPFFFLGAGFFLLEVRNLAELSLVFGSTWIVNALVIAGVLAMALLANLLAGRLTLHPGAGFALLLAAVSLGLLSPVRQFAGLPLVPRTIASVLVLSLPFFFSGLVFSSMFREAKVPAVAYGSNLLGAVFGGVIENASMIYGFRALSVFALAIYAVAWLFIRRRGAIAGPAREGIAAKL